MPVDRWRRIEEIYHAALARDAQDRAVFVAGACAGDERLREEVETLLAQESRVDTFLDVPAFDAAARAMADEHARLPAGTRVGEYEVLSLLGAGGMGEVYRARDTRLGRDVAIKFLAPVLLPDRESRARFEREARSLASLNHPGIAAIYDVEKLDGALAIVLELIEGPTLADSIRSGARRSLPDSLEIAQQIAAALEAAHDKGIIHRDLTPANVKLTPEGRVKIIDFGLAKLLPDPGVPAPAPAAAGTQAGTILGTAAHMSPEQARALPIDKRTDIWAFGTLLYELLSGRSPFARTTTSDTLAAVLNSEPDWSALPDDVPAGIRRLLERCLEKDHRRRLRDIGDARLEIEDASSSRTASRRAPNVASGRWMAAAGLTLAAVAVAVGWIWLRGSPALGAHDVVEFRAAFPPGRASLFGVSVSPSGRQVAFGVFGARSELAMLSVSSAEMQILPGTAGGSWPFWSPDDTRLAFFASGTLTRMDLTTGQSVALCDAPGPRGGSWNRDGVIIFSSLGTLLRVPDSGGTPQKLELDHPAGALVSRSFPQFLPDGRHFLFHERDTRGAWVRIGSIDSHETQSILESNTAAAFALPDHLLFVRGTALLAGRLNQQRLRLDGEPVRVAENVAPAYLAASPLYSASAGVLTYVGALAGSPGRLTWFDRGGRSSTALDGSGGAELLNPAFSPTGDRVAANRIDPVSGDWDVWIVDLARGVQTKSTFSPAQDSDPVWSPDGKSIAFNSTRDGRPALYTKAVDGTGAERVLYVSTDPDTYLVPWQWTPDNRWIVVGVTRQSPILWQLWAVPVSGDRKAVRLFPEDRIARYGGRVSPDGRWLAYASAESGQRFEIYVERFMAPGQKTQVSRDGGAHPRWSADGRELFYWAVPGGIASVALELHEDSFRASAPVTLISTPVLNLIDGRPHYDVSPDGQRFLLRQPAGPAAPGATVVLNWTDRLGAKK